MRVDVDPVTELKVLLRPSRHDPMERKHEVDLTSVEESGERDGVSQVGGERGQPLTGGVGQSGRERRRADVGRDNVEGGVEGEKRSEKALADKAAGDEEGCGQRAIGRSRAEGGSSELTRLRSRGQSDGRQI